MTHRAQRLGAMGLGACVLALTLRAGAEIPPEQVGQVRRLPETPGNHWVWVPDRLFRHSILFDGDSGQMLGSIDSGVQITPKSPLWSRTRNEIYNVDTTYSRGHRGERHDYVVIYDTRTLEVKGEVEIPPKAADTGTGIALNGMLDGERFIVVLNQSPASSVSVVDVESRRLAAEVQTAGCAAVFPAGPTRFGMLCGDGTAITVHLKESGELDRITRSRSFFDVVADPVAEKGVRDGSTWWFPSFEGLLHEVDFGGDTPMPKEPWPLFTEDERRRRATPRLSSGHQAPLFGGAPRWTRLTQGSRSSDLGLRPSRQEKGRGVSGTQPPRNLSRPASRIRRQGDARKGPRLPAAEPGRAQHRGHAR
jgi:methylamine dehydrogenase heavy chain